MLFFLSGTEQISSLSPVGVYVKYKLYACAPLCTYEDFTMSNEKIEVDLKVGKFIFLIKDCQL